MFSRLRWVTVWLLAFVLAAVFLVALGPCELATKAHGQTLVAPRARQGYYFTLGAAAFELQQWGHGRSEGLTTGALITYGLGQMLTDRWGLGFRADWGNGSAGGKARGT